MLKTLKKVGLFSLSMAMAVSAFQLNQVSVHADETDPLWQLADASFDKVVDNDVYLTFGSGQKARISFLNEQVLRIDVEPEDASFEEYPDAMEATHTTKMITKTEADYDKEYQVQPVVKGQSDGDAIEISTASVILSIDKSSAQMSLKKANGDIIWQEEESLKYDGTQTIQSLATEENENFYGGGQQNGYFSHKNRKILIENKSTWVNGGVSSPNPFYMSSNGYGVMRNTFQPGSYDFSETALMEHDENRFDAYYFVEDDMKEILNDYVELTGNPMFMPKYAFYQGNANCYNDAGEELSIDGIARAKEYQDHDMPVGWFLPNDGYGCGYGKTTDADANIANLRNFVDEAKEYGFVSGLWTENDLDKLDREVANGGTQMIKTDVAWVGEGYSFGLNAVRQAFEGIENNSNNRGFVFTVDGWAGTQRYAGLWSGDQTGGNWEYIRFHIPTYIGAGLSGQPNVGSDLDGIYGSGNVISTRDFQWKAFTPIEINMDGWSSPAEKNPWYHGEPYESINRMYLKLKTAFMPYNYTYAKGAHDNGTPMVRALMLEYPEDPFTWGNQTQYEYLWGENLLVAPVYNEADNSAGVRNNIYLPDEEQIWIDYFTGEQYQGGQVINNFDAPLWKLPLFVKNGAILPKDKENNSQLFVKGDEERIFEVYPYGNTEFTMYDDDGMTQEYKEGKASSTHITSQAPAGGKGTATITVEPTKGSFTGMKTERETHFIVNVSEKPATVQASVGGNDVVLDEVTSEADFAAAQGNVYFYNETPNLNHYATEGSEFADVAITTTPKLMVKIAKTDITSNEVVLTVDGFINDQDTVINENDPDLSNAEVPVMDAEVTDSTITLNWAMDDTVRYDLRIDGNDQAIYHNVTAPFTHESLQPKEAHTYELRVYNTKSRSAWGDVQGFATTEDRLKNAIGGLIGTASSQYDGGYEASNAVDGDESTLWYTNWNDPVANASDKIFTIEMPEAYHVDKLEYLNNGTAQIKDHEIQISLDGANYKTVEQSIWARPADGDFRVFIDLKGEAARFIRIVSHDLRHNSANEFRVYKVDGTEGFNPASTKDNKEISNNDITFLENYMGVSAQNTKLWEQARPGDFNYNNEIDAYDLAFTLAQKGLQDTGKKVAGTITWSIDQAALAAGEEATITLRGNNLKDVYAFGMRIPLDTEKLDITSIVTTGSDALKDMTNMSTMPQSSTDYVVAFSHLGNAQALQGDMELATINVKAKEATTLVFEPSNAFLVSNGFDVRTAFGGVQEPANVKQLEDVIAAATAFDTANYTSRSLQAFKQALADANSVLDDETATQEAMNEAIRGILTTLQDAQPKEKTRADVLGILFDTITTDGLSVYNQQEQDKIFAEVGKRQYLVDNPNASVATIDTALEEIKEKLMSYEDKEGTKQGSIQIYLHAAQRVVDELSDIYTVASLQALQTAIDEADQDLTAVDAAIFQLRAKDVLDLQIIEAYVNIAEAMQLSNYDSIRGAEARTALSDALATLADPQITQEMVNEEITALVTALSQVFENDVDVMKDALTQLVDHAKAIDVTNKTTSSKKALADAIALAETVLNEQPEDYDALSSAFQSLTAAINGLQELGNANKDILISVIEQAEKLNLSFYTEESAKILTEALQTAKAVAEDETADQTMVDEACKALQTAMDGLVKITVPAPTDPTDQGNGSTGNGTTGNGANTGDVTNTGSLMMLMILAGGMFYMLRKKEQSE